MDVIHKETLNTILMKSFDRLSHPDRFMEALVEKIYKRPALAQDHVESMDRTAGKRLKIERRRRMTSSPTY